MANILELYSTQSVHAINIINIIDIILIMIICHGVFVSIFQFFLNLKKNLRTLNLMCKTKLLFPSLITSYTSHENSRRFVQASSSFLGKY